MNGTIRHHLATYAEVDAEFVTRMIEGFYVDDLVTGERTDKTFTLYKNAGEQMAKGGFTLRKWKTNDPGLREMIGTCESSKRTQEVGRLEDEETYAKSKLEPHGGTKGKKLFGLAWDCKDDTLHFNFQHIADKAICDPPYDFRDKGDNTLTTRFHLKTKEIDFNTLTKHVDHILMSLCFCLT